ncbi:MAG: YtxH domain-containing protein [Terriglobales bacterium]
MSERDSGGGILWFMAGLGIGALLGVLYAPRSGEETREALRERVEDGRDFVIARGRQAKEQAAQWADRGRDVVSRQKEQLAAAVEAGKQAYRESTAEGVVPAKKS